MKRGWGATGQPRLSAELCVPGLGRWFAEGFLKHVCFSKTYCLDFALVLLHLSEHQYPLVAIATVHGEGEVGAAPQLVMPLPGAVGQWPCPPTLVAPRRPQGIASLLWPTSEVS